MAKQSEAVSVKRGLVEATESSAEPFRTLRLAIDLRPDARRGNMIVFTSADPGEGKSTVAANYALVTSLNERRVLLVDADLRNPSQHEIFGVPRSPGLTDVIGPKTPERNVLHAIKAEGQLDVLTAGTPVPRAGDLTVSTALNEMLTRACEEYDVVVIDTPPVLAASDAAHLASHPQADLAFVINSSQRTRRVQRAVNKLELVGVNILGFVVNREGRLSEYGY